jgi:hypothetical protein
MTAEVAGGVSFTLRDAGSKSSPIKTVTRGSDLEDGPPYDLLLKVVGGLVAVAELALGWVRRFFLAVLP